MGGSSHRLQVTLIMLTLGEKMPPVKWHDVPWTNPSKPKHHWAAALHRTDSDVHSQHLSLSPQLHFCYFIPSIPSPSIAHALKKRDESSLTQSGMALVGPALPVPMATQSVLSLVPVPFPPHSPTSCVRLFKKKNEYGGSHPEITFLEAILIT